MTEYRDDEWSEALDHLRDILDQANMPTRIVGSFGLIDGVYGRVLYCGAARIVMAKQPYDLTRYARAMAWAYQQGLTNPE